MRWPLTKKVIDSTLLCSKSAYRGDLGALVLGDIRHGKRVLVDIPADKECARLGQGCPPSEELLLRQHAALVSSKLTRVPLGVNLPPLEVIMSRQL